MSSTFSLDTNDDDTMIFSPQSDKLSGCEASTLGEKAPVYRTPCNRQTLISDDVACVPLRLVRKAPESIPSSLSETEIVSTPVNLTSLITAIRTTKVEESPPPMIPELLNCQEPSDFERLALTPGDMAVPGRCRPSLRPKGEVLRSRARRVPMVEPVRTSSRQSRQDRKLSSLLRKLPEMPDTDCLMEDQRRSCPALKPRMLSR